MKINKSNNTSRKFVYGLIGLVLLCSAGAITYWYYSQNSSNLETPATESQKKAGEQTKQEFLNEKDVEQPTSSKTLESATPNDARVIITEALQSEDKSIRVGSIVQSANGNGNCSLILAKGTQVIKQSTAALPQSNYAACPDFVIPYSQLSPGMWKATVTYQDEEKRGEASKDVEVN